MAVNGSFYGRERFDPLLILAQIVLLQCCFYASYLILLVIFNYATGTTARLSDQIFNHTLVTLRHFPGWVTCSALLVSAAGPTALAFVAIVGRARRCLDFACTLFISHLIATSLHSGFPVSLMWWLCNILATASLAAVAESLSLRIELRQIAIPTTISQEERTNNNTRRSDHNSKNSIDNHNDNHQLDTLEIVSSSSQIAQEPERISVATAS